MNWIVYFLVGFGFAATMETSPYNTAETFGKFVVRNALWPVAAGVVLAEAYRGNGDL